MDINNLNNASVQDLEHIEGIGRRRAEDIVHYRDRNGGFKGWDDLRDIPGFDNELVNVLKTGGKDWGPGAEE